MRYIFLVLRDVFFSYWVTWDFETSHCPTYVQIHYLKAYQLKCSSHRVLRSFHVNYHQLRNISLPKYDPCETRSGSRFSREKTLFSSTDTFTGQTRKLKEEGSTKIEHNRGRRTIDIQKIVGDFDEINHSLDTAWRRLSAVRERLCRFERDRIYDPVPRVPPSFIWRRPRGSSLPILPISA